MLVWIPESLMSSGKVPVAWKFRCGGRTPGPGGRAGVTYWPG